MLDSDISVNLYNGIISGGKETTHVYQRAVGPDRRYPAVPIIIGHLGGIHWLATLQGMREIPNIYLDLSATFTTLAPAYAIKEFPRRCLFSSDAPYSSPLAARTLLEQLTDDAGVLRQVLGENAAELLRL